MVLKQNKLIVGRDVSLRTDSIVQRSQAVTAVQLLDAHYQHTVAVHNHIYFLCHTLLGLVTHLYILQLDASLANHTAAKAVTPKEQ